MSGSPTPPHNTQQQHPQQLSSSAVAARIKLPEPNCKHRFTTSFLQLREDGCRKARLGVWTRPKGRGGRAADLPAGRDRSGACCTIHCLWGGAVVETATHTKTQNNQFSLPERQPVKLYAYLFFKHPDQYCLVTTTLTDSTLRPDYSTRPLFPVSHKTFHSLGINARATAYQALFHASSASITNRVYFIPSEAVSENCHWRISAQSPASLLDCRSQPSSTRRGLPR